MITVHTSGKISINVVWLGKKTIKVLLMSIPTNEATWALGIQLGALKIIAVLEEQLTWVLQDF